MYDLLARGADGLSRLMAFLGGAVLIALVAMTCVSIIGRALVPLGLAPVKGDFEWIEIGMGLAVFAFLPWCQLTRAHARVDLFEPAFPPLVNRLIECVVDAAMCAAAIVLAWRLALGMLDKQRYGETTFILQFPVWQAYAAALAGAVAFALVAAFCVIRSLRALVREDGRETMRDDQAGGH